MLVIAIGHCGSCGDLNSREIRTKNRSVCENAVTGIWRSDGLLVKTTKKRFDQQHLEIVNIVSGIEQLFHEPELDMK